MPTPRSARLVTATLLLWGCMGTPPSAPTPKPPPAPTPAPFRVTNPASLADFVPPTLGGLPTERTEDVEGTVRAVARDPDRTLTLTLTRATDIRAARARYELLGRDVEARMAGEEVRGVRLQGNPAQLQRQLDAPHRGTLTAIAANTFIVQLTVEPTEDLESLVTLSDQLDIGGLTRLALKEARPTPEADGSTSERGNPPTRKR